MGYLHRDETDKASNAKLDMKDGKSHCVVEAVCATTDLEEDFRIVL